MHRFTPFIHTTSLAAVLCVLSSGAMAQGLPQAPQNQPEWDFRDTRPSRITTSNAPNPNFDAFTTTAVDKPSLHGLTPSNVHASTVAANAIQQTAALSRQHTFPGGVDALHALSDALYSFRDSPKARATALMRTAEIRLRLAGQHNNATIVATGADILARGETKPAIAYMRGIARDLRNVGAITGARHLENTISLATEQLGDTSGGVLDAATLALRFGANPNQNVAKILAYDPQSVRETIMRDLMVSLIKDIGTTIPDPAYAALAEALERNSSPAGLARLHEQLPQTTPPRQPQNQRPQTPGRQNGNSLSTILNRN